MPPRISVIIPARNAAPVIATQLDALAAQKYEGEWEVIVADNASRDGTALVVRNFKDLMRLRIIVADQFVSPGYTRNAAARVANGDLLCFCDADDQIGPGWLAAFARAAKSADAIGGRIDEISLNNARVLRWRSALARSGLPDAWYYLPYASSANFAIWKTVFDSLLGFNENLLSCEDVDLCWRLQQSGGTLGYADDAIVAYRHRTSLIRLAHQNYMRARWAVPLVYAHRQGDCQGPHLATLLERILYWDPIIPTRLSVGRLVAALAMEIGILAGRLSRMLTSRPCGRA
jgi:glycosyltransferase involved in cell wall biosynthesis